MGQRFRNLTRVLLLLGVAVVLWVVFGRVWGPGPSVSPPSSIPGDRPRVKVEVLNGGGVSGVAWAATEALRDQGFDVVFFGNAETFTEDSSVVLDRVHDLDRARDVAEALGILRVLSDPDSTLFVDVTVLLGPDWMGTGSTARREEQTSAHWSSRMSSMERVRLRSDSPNQP